MVNKRSKLYILPNSKTGLIYIHPSIVTDNNFPFQHEDNIKVMIIGKKLVLEKNGG